MFHVKHPLPVAEVPALLAALRAVAGPDLLRLKGFVPLEGDAHLVIQGAMMVVHDSAPQPGPPPGGGRLVAITEGAAPPLLAAALAPFGIS